MLKRALTAASIALASLGTSYAEPAQTIITGRTDMKSVYQSSNTGPMRTLLTRENKYPNLNQAEVSGFYDHNEMKNLEQDVLGAGARYGLWENITVGGTVPVVLDSEFEGDSHSGLGDLGISLDLLAFQDIFRYPFIIPHFDFTLPTGDEDKGLGSGESIINMGISVGTKVYDALTYVVDFSYAFNGASYFEDTDDNLYMVSGSLVWDISDRLALLAEGRLYEKTDLMEDTPFEANGGLAYRLTRDVQIAAYGGVVDPGTGEEDGEDEDYNQAMVKVTVQF